MTVKRWTRRNTSQASDGQARSADLRLAGRPTPKWLAGRSCTGRNRGRGRATSYVSGHGRRLLLGTDNRVRLWEAFARSIAVRNVARAVGLRPLRPGELTAVQPVRDDSGRPSRVTSRFRLLVLSNGGGAAPSLSPRHGRFFLGTDDRHDAFQFRNHRSPRGTDGDPHELTHRHSLPCPPSADPPQQGAPSRGHGGCFFLARTIVPMPPR
jgi:hypothetical protein